MHGRSTKAKRAKATRRRSAPSRSEFISWVVLSTWRGHGANYSAPMKLMAGCRNIRVDRKSTRLNSSHVAISYAVFCLKKKKAGIELDGALKIFAALIVARRAKITPLMAILELE